MTIAKKIWLYIGERRRTNVSRFTIGIGCQWDYCVHVGSFYILPSEHSIFKTMFLPNIKISNNSIDVFIKCRISAIIVIYRAKGL